MEISSSARRGLAAAAVRRGSRNTRAGGRTDDCCTARLSTGARPVSAALPCRLAGSPPPAIERQQWTRSAKGRRNACPGLKGFATRKGFRSALRGFDLAGTGSAVSMVGDTLGPTRMLQATGHAAPTTRGRRTLALGNPGQLQRSECHVSTAPSTAVLISVQGATVLGEKGGLSRSMEKRACAKFGWDVTML